MYDYNNKSVLVHMYAKIVLVFDDIENYIAKATITAWGKSKTDHF